MNKLLAIACPLLLLVAVAKAHGLAEVDALAGLNYGLGDGEVSCISLTDWRNVKSACSQHGPNAQ